MTTVEQGQVAGLLVAIAVIILALAVLVPSQRVPWWIAVTVLAATSATLRLIQLVGA